MKTFQMNPGYKSRAGVRVNGREIKASVRAIVRVAYSDGSADAIANDGLSYRINSHVVTRAGLYPLAVGTELVIATAEGADDIASSIARA